MNITVSESNGKLSVKIKGDIYIDQANELLVTFNDIIEKNPKEVVDKIVVLLKKGLVH